MKDTRFLIVGGDGVIGCALSNAIRLQNGSVTCTTRARAEKNVFHLDLQHQQSVDAFDVSGYDIAYFCAGWSKFSDIESNPVVSRLINVTNTLKLCARLMQAGCSIVFLSTAAVFDGERRYPDESVQANPTTLYGQQKYEVEGALLDLEKQANTFGLVKIVRISKVLTSQIPLIDNWRNSLARGEKIKPLMDLRLSPVSFPYAVQGLLDIGRLDRSGIFHLSGEKDVSYADFVHELTLRWGYSPSQVRPVSSIASDIVLPYSPKFPSLGMTLTTRAIRTAPQLFEDFIVDLTD